MVSRYLFFKNILRIFKKIEICYSRINFKSIKEINLFLTDNKFSKRSKKFLYYLQAIIWGNCKKKEKGNIINENHKKIKIDLLCK